MTRHWLIFAAIATLLVVGTAVVINTRPLQVRYHNWQMQRAWHQMYSNPLPPTGDGLITYAPGEALQRYEYHRQRLVTLGDVAERHYTFKHLKVRTDESKHLSKLILHGLRPKCIDFSSPYPTTPPATPEPMLLTVWCRPADTADWDEFVAKHDVANYCDRFMTTEKLRRSPAGRSSPVAAMKGGP